MLSRKKQAASVVSALVVSFALVNCGPAPQDLVPKDGVVRFTAAGDMGMGKDAKAVLDKIKNLAPDFNVALGDLSYKPGAEQEFCDLVSGKLGRDFPYEVVAGNHESNGSDGSMEKFVACLPNRLPGLQGEYGKQWYVDVPQEQPLMRLIMVSPGLEFPDGRLDYANGNEHWRWTESAIDGARDANIPWTVVGMHKLCFSLGKHGCDAGQGFTNLLIRKKVDLVLTGHEHVYQRTHQLGLGSGCPYVLAMNVTRECVVDNDDTMTKGNGTVFATVGVGGKDISRINMSDSEMPYFAAWSGDNQQRAFGTLDVTVRSGRMDVRFQPAGKYTFTDSFSLQQ